MRTVVVMAVLMVAALEPAEVLAGCPSDINNDGVVDSTDLALVLGSWGPCPPAGCQDNSECDDGDACTTDVCDPGQGVCQNTPVVCDDNNGCTIDTCDPAVGCQFTPDDGAPCDDGDPCTTDACLAGTCVGQGDPEVCDGLDNDCDDIIDNNLVPPPCELENGVCSGSVQTCAGAAGWQPCSELDYGPNYEITEFSCDGLDNDCDGVQDEGCVDCPGGTGVLVLEALDCSDAISAELDASHPSQMGGSCAVGACYLCGEPVANLQQINAEDAYSFLSQTSGPVTVLFNNFTCDLDFYVVVDPCDPFTTCVAGSTDSVVGSDSVTFEATENVRYYIVVEAFGETTGLCAYDLSFDTAAGSGCPENCVNGVDDDGDGDIDCDDPDCQNQADCAP